ncbi:MAG: PilZ domain-containing protein [Candidatus Omnitrophica bacterium]|nr:PilZ domain-containing protein [Candidatus Omnitrophota bacterium]
MISLLTKRVMSADGRKYRRFKAFSLLKFFQISDPDQRRSLVNGRDISAGGASFFSDSELPLNSIVKADIYFPPLNDFIAVMAKVARVLRIKDREQSLIGLNFVLIDPENRSRIDSYISRMANDPVGRAYLDRQAAYYKRHL